MHSGRDDGFRRSDSPGQRAGSQSKEIDATTLGVMQKIKQQFDPNNILNPGKTLPAIISNSPAEN
ncbi:MAG: hypothetical protein IH991_08780 [Planctomycetes bacterium]|nr:hypothetical protein [Planctomycetota bacterium]